MFKRLKEKIILRLGGSLKKEEHFLLPEIKTFTPNIIPIQTVARLSEEEYKNIPDESLCRIIAENLVEGIIEKNLLTYETEFDPATREKIIRARIDVMEPNLDI